MNIQSLDEFKEIIRLLKIKYLSSAEPLFLYRGHSDHLSYKLLPGEFRTSQGTNSIIRPFNQDELGILNEYIKDSKRSLDTPKSWIEIAQHYGVPTRLMDLTEDEYVALYFACCDESKSFPSVWIVNKPQYDKLFYFQEKSVDAKWSSEDIVGKILNDEIVNIDHDVHNDAEKFIINPFIYRPEWVDFREKNQKSWFMLWGARQDELDKILESYGSIPISTDDTVKSCDKSWLGVITVDKRYRGHILDELEAEYPKSFIYPTDDDHGVRVNKKNYNKSNTQYRKYVHGGVQIELKDTNPNKNKWKEN